MSNKYEIKHHKDLHRVQLQGLKVKERSIFMALCYKAMNQESNILDFDVNEIAKLSGYTPTKAGDNIYKYMRETYKSLKNITIETDNSEGFHDFILFTSIKSFENKGIIQFKVNEDYRYLLNKVASPFTIQNMIEYKQLDSKYSQLMYSMLKHWEGQKYIVIDIKDFKQKLDIPKSFKISHIDIRVLTPIKKELSQYFLNLKIEKIKTGRKVTSIKFSWTEKEKNKKEKLPLINYIETQEKENPVIIANKCREIHGSDCTGGQQKEVICTLCNLMNKKNINKY